MGQTKNDMEEKEARNEHSGKYCWRTGNEIPLDDLEYALQDDGRYLCADCRAELDKIMSKE